MGCPLNIIYTGHCRSHGGINNLPLRRLERSLLIQTLFPLILSLAFKQETSSTTTSTLNTVQVGCSHIYIQPCRLSLRQHSACQNPREQTVKCCSPSTQRCPLRRHPLHLHPQKRSQASPSSQRPTHGTATMTRSSSSTQPFLSAPRRRPPTTRPAMLCSTGWCRGSAVALRACSAALGARNVPGGGC